MNCCKCSVSMGLIFYASINTNGVTSSYCFDCYSATFLDNMEMKADKFEEKELKCECGSGAPKSQNHGSWCDLFKNEFK